MRIKLFTDPLVAVVSPGHPAAGKPYLNVDDLASGTFITYGIESEPGFEDATIFPTFRTLSGKNHARRLRAGGR